MDNKKDTFSLILNILKIIFLIGLMLTIPFIISFFSFIPIKGNLDAWIGYWGSMSGSTIAIVGSLFLLKKQIDDSNKSLQKQISNDNKNIQEQRKDETFYSLLNLFLREQERLQKDRIETKKDTFESLVNTITLRYSYDDYFKSLSYTSQGVKIEPERKKAYEDFDFLKEQEFFFNEYQTVIVEQELASKHSILGNYFRMFHRTLKYINDNFKGDIRKEHLGTLRAVLPEFELLIIFNNAFYTHRGENMKNQFKTTNFFGDAEDFINVDKGNDHIFFQKKYLSNPEFIMNRMKECFSVEEDRKYKKSKEENLENKKWICGF